MTWRIEGLCIPLTNEFEDIYALELLALARIFHEPRREAPYEADKIRRTKGFDWDCRKYIYLCGAQNSSPTQYLSASSKPQQKAHEISELTRRSERCAMQA